MNKIIFCLPKAIILENNNKALATIFFYVLESERTFQNTVSIAYLSGLILVMAQDALVFDICLSILSILNQA